MKDLNKIPKAYPNVNAATKTHRSNGRTKARSVASNAFASIFSTNPANLSERYREMREIFREREKGFSPPPMRA